MSFSMARQTFINDIPVKEGAEWPMRPLPPEALRPMLVVRCTGAEPATFEATVTIGGRAILSAMANDFDAVQRLAIDAFMDRFVGLLAATAD